MHARIEQMLTADTPRCGNCKWLRPAAIRGTKKGTTVPEGTHVPGKGICMEPTAAVAAGRTPFFTTDMALCSQWEPKDA